MKEITVIKVTNRYDNVPTYVATWHGHELVAIDGCRGFRTASSPWGTTQGMTEDGLEALRSIGATYDRIILPRGEGARLAAAKERLRREPLPIEGEVLCTITV